MVAVKLSNRVKPLDYMWMANVFFEDTHIHGPTKPAKTVQKSLTEMLVEDSKKSEDLMEKSEDLYKAGPGVLVMIQ